MINRDKRGYPLSLSILISGGKETSKDFSSNDERRSTTREK